MGTTRAVAPSLPGNRCTLKLRALGDHTTNRQRPPASSVAPAVTPGLRSTPAFGAGFTAEIDFESLISVRARFEIVIAGKNGRRDLACGMPAQE